MQISLMKALLQVQTFKILPIIDFYATYANAGYLQRLI